jgi:hypothetical protein
MGLRCLLGHDYGETEIEREREEDGDEMVVTIREIERCTRCGKEKVLSENKEITSIRSAEAVGIEDDSAEPATAESDAAGSGVAPADVEQDGRPADEPTAEPDPVAVEERDDEPGIEDEPATAHIDSAEGEAFEPEDEEAEPDAEPSEPPASAAEDDGVILDEDAPAEEREQWADDEVAQHEQGEPPAGVDAELDDPSTDVDPEGDAVAPDPSEVTDDAEFIDGTTDDGPGTPGGQAGSPAGDRETSDWHGQEEPPAETSDAGEVAWPEPEGDDEGFDAEPADGTGVDDVSFTGGGLTPESNGSLESSTESADSEATVVGRDDTAQVEERFTGTDGQSFESSVETTTAETEYFCPNCQTTWQTVRSSLRPGDMCPECHRGYIGERER